MSSDAHIRLDEYSARVSKHRCSSQYAHVPCFFVALEVDASSLPDHAREAATAFGRDGLVRIKNILPVEVAEALCARVREELKQRRHEGDAVYFGDVYGYEDCGQRWDLKLQLSNEVKIALTSILGRLQKVLETLRPSWQLTELAAMCTFPSDPGQPVHADTSHVYDQQVVTIFVALHDISPERGPTKMYPKSHLDGELHLGMKEVDEASAVLCTMNMGDCVVMDSRLLHCGTANTSDLHRFLFYTSWMQPARRSRGSTNTILPEYEERLSLRTWQDWTAPGIFMLIATSGDGMRQACEVVVREPVGFSRAFQLQLFCSILESAAAGMALAGLGLLVFNLAGPRLFVAPQPEMLGIPRQGLEARGDAVIMCAAKPGGPPVDVTKEAMPASTIKVRTGKGELTVDQQMDRKERVSRWLRSLKGKFVYKGPKPYDVDQFIKVNIAVPLAPKQASNTKIMNQVVEELRRISGVHPVATYFKANNADLGYRVGDPSGAKVNLRGHLMQDFLQRLNTIVLPRVRDFEGLDPTSFNRNANYWMHLPSQEPFNELDELVDSREVVHGFNIRILNNCFTQPDALKLMQEFGFPFGDPKPKREKAPRDPYAKFKNKGKGKKKR
ncbi:rpl5 [Symbiodinium pilosum]|uniref:Rpl5 protein n=1 Tax=Symbiodinium pilosum TaxID=2952 RepID=A0A812Y0E2_SYMPI|nr:rpl5 [Symbiodinium pilosum]